jgi:hypothetical protein
MNIRNILLLLPMCMIACVGNVEESQDPTASEQIGTAEEAVTPGEVVGAAKAAYQVYQMFNGGQLTLADAKAQIVSAINAARTQIVAHIDAIATAEVQACAMSAVINVADIQAMSPDTLQVFALNTTDCVAHANTLLNVTTDKAAIDQLGFALNTVGPIALVARATAGLTTPATKSTLITANNTLITRLAPSCTATPLWGDSAPGEPVEVMLRCIAYNGHEGYDSAVAFIRRGRPLPPFNYTYATTEAMAGTSYEVAKAVLPVLNAS